MLKKMTRSRQAAYTLIEVLIAMGLGAFVVAGAATVLSANKGAFITQQEVGQNQETGRAGMYVVSETLRMSGYYPVTVYPSGLATAVNPFTAGTGACNATPRMAICGTGVAPNEEIFVRYIGDGSSVIDCTGATVAAGATVTNRIYMSAAGIGGMRSLLCEVNGGVSQPIADGVTSLTLLYGVDTNIKRNSTPNQYLPATAVADWTRVRSVQITLVATASSRVSPNLAAKNPLSHTFTATVVLRNRGRAV